MNEQPIILGGGLAGLSACYHGNGIIYEQDERVGGVSKSETKDGFTFDEGIHVLHTKDEYVLKLLEETNANLETKERDAWIVSHGAMTRYPFQANTYGLPVDIVKDCLLGFIQNDSNDLDKVKNYQDWLYLIFGKGITEHFMIPYSQKFWGINPDLLTTDWVNVRHPRPSMEEVVSGALEDQSKGFGVNATFSYPKEGGYGNIAESMASACRDRINCGMKVTKIDLEKNEIEFNENKSIPYQHIISSLPLPDLINIIADVPDDIKDAVKKLRTNSIFAVNIGVDRANITDKHWIYFLEKDFSFIRISFPFNQAKSVAPEGTSSISAEIAYGNDNPLPASKDKMSERVIKDLIKAKIITAEDKIIFSDTVDIEKGYVIYDDNRKLAVDVIHKYLKANNIIPCGRYGNWGYVWTDEAILSGKEAAESLPKS